MTVHSSFVASAIRLIAKHGRNITLTTTTNSGTDWNPTQSTSDATVKAVNVKITEKQIEAGLATAESRAYLIDSQQTVSKGQSITDGDTYNINRVEEIKPGNQSILYRVFVSK